MRALHILCFEIMKKFEFLLFADIKDNLWPRYCPEGKSIIHA